MVANAVVLQDTGGYKSVLLSEKLVEHRRRGVARSQCFCIKKHGDFRTYSGGKAYSGHSRDLLDPTYEMLLSRFGESCDIIKACDANLHDGKHTWINVGHHRFHGISR